MRLLNTKSLKFREFFEDEIPPYAILSHTWGSVDDEVSFRDMGLEPEILWRDREYGYSKILNTCRLAVDDGLEYAWVDTCCIDKSSSAELTESINSMFRWYENADICYVYLPDVTPQRDLKEGIRACRWITRGWTLQELIAPRECELLDSEWVCRGRKTELSGMLAMLTRVPSSVLAGERLAREFTVAQRMSWAAKRTTSRREDMAYCLLGLFGIQMSMIYGEGDMAFHRLQEEIIRRTDDETIFAWNPPDLAPGVISILASSPAAFREPRPMVKWAGWHPSGFTLTNKGLKFADARASVVPQTSGDTKVVYLLRVGDSTPHDGSSGIFLRKVDGDLFCRINSPMRSRLPEYPPESRKIEIYVADFCAFPVTRGMILDSRRAAVRITVPPLLHRARYLPWHLWDHEDCCFLTGARSNFAVHCCGVSGTVLGQKVDLAVLVNRSTNTDRGTPVLSLFDVNKHRRHWDYILGYSSKNSGMDLSWSRAKQNLPGILSHGDSTEVSLKGAVLKISISVAREMIPIREGDVEMWQAKLEVNVEEKDQSQTDIVEEKDKSEDDDVIPK